MDEGGVADFLVWVDAAGQVEAIFQGFAPVIVVAKRIVVIFKTGIEQASEGHGHRYSPPS
jgi:hypothetical protein